MSRMPERGQDSAAAHKPRAAEVHDSLRSQLRWVTVAALVRRYDELLQWTQKKHLVVIPTFEAQDMQLAYQTATGRAPVSIATF